MKHGTTGIQGVHEAYYNHKYIFKQEYLQVSIPPQQLL